MATPLDIPDVQWRRVSDKQIGVEMIGAAITAVVTIAAAIVFLVLGWWIPAIVIGVMALSTVITAAFIPRRVRAYGYALRDDDLLFRRGLLFQRFVAVPYGRMQLVDINRGPVARGFGLSELKLVTAAATTAITIPGLTEDDAISLRDHLVDVAETRRVGL
ncbi:MAG: PH domain-containing protein [Naasia sp.]